MQRKYRAVIGITLSASLLVAGLYSLNVLGAWQEKLHDRLFVLEQTPHNIVIVAIDSESLSAIGQWPWRREVFARTLTAIGSAQAIGIDINFAEPSRFGAADDQALAQVLTTLPTPVVLPVELRERGGTATTPLSIFSTVTKQGFVNVITDPDGIVRTIATAQNEYESFSQKLAAYSTGTASVPTILRIHYRGPAKTMLTIPLIDVLEGRVPRTVFTDATVLVGVTSNDLHDIVSTPWGLMPGVEVHAQALATLHDGQVPTDIPAPIAYISFILAAALGALCVAYSQRLALIIVFLTVGAGLIIGAWVIAFQTLTRLPILYLLLAFVLASVGTLVWQYVTESKEKRFIRKSFQYYLMPEIIDQLMLNPERLKLGGEKRTVSILFSDIRGFTTISEQLSAEQLTTVINEYLTAMTDIVMDNRGLVDKYIGDAIMAFWGAPIDNPLHATHACTAAIKMSHALRTLNTGWIAKGQPPLAIGIGINTGDVVVGNMGSQRRFNYTIMGDEVNFASRLEGTTKAYGVECIISESVKTFITKDPAHTFVLRELDQVLVKGKKAPRRLFQLLTESTEHTSRIIEHFGTGREHYYHGHWSDAIHAFDAALALGADGPATTLRERCLYLQEHPPVAWTGVYEFKTK